MDMSNTPTADLLLHPVRWRIVQALQDRQLTTTKLRDLLEDVPPATLYRQIATLVRADVLQVVAERKVRGAVERTYALRADDLIKDAEGSSMDIEQHRRLFRAFATQLQIDFERYLDSDEPDPVRDQVHYRQAALNLTGGELAELSVALNKVMAPYLDREPAKGSRRYLLSTAMIPNGATEE